MKKLGKTGWIIIGSLLILAAMIGIGSIKKTYEGQRYQWQNHSEETSISTSSEYVDCCIRKTALKRKTMYDSDGNEICVLIVKATFDVQPGKSVRCISSSVTQKTYYDDWTVINTSSKEDNSSNTLATACAEGVFKNEIMNKEIFVTVSLNCDIDGNYS